MSRGRMSEAWDRFAPVVDRLSILINQNLPKNVKRLPVGKTHPFHTPKKKRKGWTTPASEFVADFRAGKK